MMRLSRDGFWVECNTFKLGDHRYNAYYIYIKSGSSIDRRAHGSFLTRSPILLRDIDSILASISQCWNNRLIGMPRSLMHEMRGSRMIGVSTFLF